MYTGSPMMEIFTCEQGTDEWFECRRGIPTASCFSDILAKGAGKTRRRYMLRLIAERITEQPHPAFSNAHMERGHELEGEARSLYELRSDNTPEQVGFIRNGEKGASPDALIGADGMLEIKTKLPDLQLGLILDGELPEEHAAQVQGQLWVAEREWCDFVSYWPRLPLFVVRVYRDEKYIETLAEAVDEFTSEMAEVEEKIRSYE